MMQSDVVGVARTIDNIQYYLCQKHNPKMSCQHTNCFTILLAKLWLVCVRVLELVV